MNFEQAYDFVIDALKKELPPHITYHNAEHTNDVIDAVRELCKKEKVSDRESKILETAALFHDSGFLKGYDNHESLSCEVAKEMLPKFGYTRYQIDQICDLIMATKLPQNPANHLEEIICDADLFYLGSDNYFVVAERLHSEFKAAGKVKEDSDWYKTQIDFLKKHRFFTLTAVKEIDGKKNENLQQLLVKQELQKIARKRKHPLYHLFQDFFLMVLGVLVAGFALKGFLIPNQFFDGGVTGISLLLHELYHFPISLVIILVNLPLIYLGWRTIGKTFAWKTLVSVLLLGVCMVVVPYPEITKDKLLISMFGGFFLGIGVGLTMRAGCALDGIEVLAINTFKRTSFTVTEIILALNICIFGIAAFELGIETALYSVLVYFTASKTVDYVIEGIEAYTGVTIISGKSELIKYRLVNELGRGITVYKGERGFLPGKFEVSTDCDIIFTVVTRLEMRRLKNLVQECDPKAFVFANTIREATGGILRCRQMH